MGRHGPYTSRPLHGRVRAVYAVENVYMARVRDRVTCRANGRVHYRVMCRVYGRVRAVSDGVHGRARTVNTARTRHVTQQCTRPVYTFSAV